MSKWHLSQTWNIAPYVSSILLALSAATLSFSPFPRLFRNSYRHLKPLAIITYFFDSSPSVLSATEMLALLRLWSNALRGAFVLHFEIAATVQNILVWHFFEACFATELSVGLLSCRSLRTTVKKNRTVHRSKICRILTIPGYARAFSRHCLIKEFYLL